MSDGGTSFETKPALNSAAPNPTAPNSTAPNSTAPNSTALNPTALTVADVAKMLSAAGRQRVTPEQIGADVAAGAPTNADGTINLVFYAAWLAKEMANRDD